MHIVFFGHPTFVGSQSMNRFAKLLAEGMQTRGHTTELWLPEARFAGLNVPALYKKWLGYIDQYILFPTDIRNRLKSYPSDTLFVFTDHALGPWVPLVTNRPHVIHCHDFLAQRSALGEIPENPTSWTGRQYQRFIRRGFSKGTYFIADSRRTQDDLPRLINHKSVRSEMVYIGLNDAFTPSNPHEARALLSRRTGLDLTNGYLLHVGSDVWYKNRTGVIDIYDAVRKRGISHLPLLMIGQSSSSAFRERHARSPFTEAIHLVDAIDGESMRLAYAGAELLLFPSLAEGFGWPIAEAMASGCPVITTNESPMTEVAGSAAFFIPRQPNIPSQVEAWTSEAANVVDSVLKLSPVAREHVIEAGLLNAERFNPAHYLDNLEAIYNDVLNTFACS